MVSDFYRNVGNRARRKEQAAQEGITGQLQAGIGQSPQPLTAGQIQAAGGQVQQQRAQATSEARQQALQTEVGRQQQAQQVQQRQIQAEQFDVAMEIEKTKVENQKKLFNLNRQLGNQLFTNQMKFKQDEIGREFLNDRQLADYALIQARTEEDWLKYEQQVSQMSKRRLQLLKAAYAKIKQAQEQDWRLGEQGLDQEHKKYLVEHRAKIMKKIKEEQARASNRASMFAAGGMIIGGAIGALVPGGGPATAMLGANIGRAAGTFAASQLD